MAEKNIYISYLRVIATAFVILIHASTGFLYQFDAQSFDWNYANWINSATRCSVPIFIMISGALLLHKDEDSIIFYKKRLSKILYPFIFWTIIYLIYYFYRYTNFEVLSSKRVFEISMDKILHGSNAHLWYLYMIVGLYIAIPFLRKILRQASLREIEIFLICWVLSMLFTNKRLFDFVPKFDLTFFSGYLGYLILGYYLTIKKWNWNKSAMLIVYVLITAITGYATFVLSNEIKKLDTFLYNYVFINTALAAASIFIFVKLWASSKTSAPKWVQIIDEHSFGIYLAHIIPLNYLHPLISKYVSTAWVIPLATISTLIASILITYVLRKMPYGKYVSG